MKVLKTIKLYINGKLTRTESGRSFALLNNKGKHYANICHGSRKDFRNAVDIAIEAQKKWSATTAFLKSQILYRMAEMMEGKKDEFVFALNETSALSKDECLKEVEKSIDHFVYYAGFCDKYQQVLGSVNPVSGPFHNFTTPEPIGVVTLIDNDEFKLSNLIENICSILVSGNSLVIILNTKGASLLAPISEVLATSDLPAGVINLISAFYEELEMHIANHREVRAISFQRGSEAEYLKLKSASVDNMKRVIGPFQNEDDPLKRISSFIEYKTVWHPIGI